MNPRLEEVSEWLQKAEQDLLSARILLEHDPPVLETTCFHSQQAVEKALKAYLVWRGIPFERVHSLTYLLDLCQVQEPQFAPLRNRVETLAPYAIEVRYPGSIMDVSQEEAQEAVATMESLWNFILALIPIPN